MPRGRVETTQRRRGVPGYVSILVKEGHFACILVLDWIFNWVGLTQTPAWASVCFVHYIGFTITLFSAYSSSISCLEPSAVD